MGFQKRRYAFCTAFKPPPAASNPSQRLWPTPASQACLFSSYGLPKATLRILHRLQTLPRDFKPFPAPLAYSCIAALPASAGSPPAPLAYSCIADLPLLFLWASKSDVRHFAPPSNPPPRLQTLPSAFGLLLRRSLACASREPGERASGTCSPCTAAPAPLADSCIAGLPLLFLWASKSDVRHFAPPSNPPPRLQTLRSAFKPSAAPLGLLLHRSLALFSAAGLPLLFLWASKSDVRHFGLPSNPPQRLQTLCSAFKPSAAPLAYSCTAALPSSRQQACPPQRSNPPQRETLWNRTLQP